MYNSLTIELYTLTPVVPVESSETKNLYTQTRISNIKMCNTLKKTEKFHFMMFTVQNSGYNVLTRI